MAARPGKPAPRLKRQQQGLDLVVGMLAQQHGRRPARFRARLRQRGVARRRAASSGLSPGALPASTRRTCSGTPRRAQVALAMPLEIVGRGLQAVMHVEGRAPAPASAARRPARAVESAPPL
jgi:hypothetical protein